MKMKELGPRGGAHSWRPLGSANGYTNIYKTKASERNL